MATTPTPPGDRPDALAASVDDLLTGFGAFVGEPDGRERVVRRLLHGVQVTDDDVDLLEWYFEHVEGQGKLTHMGGFVVSKLSDTAAAKDTIAGARKVRDRLRKKNERGRTNQNFGTDGPTEWDRRATELILAQRDLWRAVCYHVLDLEWDHQRAAEYHGIDSNVVRDIIKGSEHVYLRQMDRPVALRYRAWVDGRKPIPQDETPNPRTQPGMDDIKRSVGLSDDGIGPVYGEKP